MINNTPPYSTVTIQDNARSLHVKTINKQVS